MNKLAFALIFFLSSPYAWVEGNSLRDIQQEVNEINVFLNTNKLNAKERSFLLGKSCGLFVAMEIIVRNEKNKKTPSNGKQMRGKYFDFLPNSIRSLKISQQ